MTPYLCPDCRGEIDPETLGCPSGHRFTENDDGVLALVSRDMAPRLERFIEALGDYRERQGRRILDPSVYDGLPENLAAGDFEWRLRCYDLEILRRLIPAGRRTVLDVGAFNGWLSRRLAVDGHDVTAVDTFTDPYDGLGARRHYRRAEWRAIQLDLRDLGILGRTFDFVVVNRCLQFFADPADYFEHARERLAPGGLLVATGLDFLRFPGRKRRAIERRDRAYRERYGLSFFLHETRGFLDFGDRRRLRAAGLEIRPYPQLWRQNALSLVLPHRPRFCYGVSSAAP